MICYKVTAQRLMDIHCCNDLQPRQRFLLSRCEKGNNFSLLVGGRVTVSIKVRVERDFLRNLPV